MATMEQTLKQFDTLGLTLNGFSNGIKETSVLASERFLKSVKSIGSKIFNWENTKKLMQSTVGGAIEEQKLKDMFIARTGGTAAFDKIKQDALNSGQDVQQALKGSLSFLPMTSNKDQLGQLNNFAQRLNVIGAGGKNFDGAVKALEKAMQGDTSSLAQEFDISEAVIKQSGISSMGKIDSSNMDDFLKRFSQMMENANMGQAAFEQMLDSPAVKWQSILNNLKSQFTDAGSSALQSISPVLDKLFADLQSGRFQPFFDMLGAGITNIAYIAGGLANVIMQIAGFIMDNWSFIGPVILGIAAAFLIYNTVLKANAIWTGIITAVKTAAAGMETLRTRTMSAATAATVSQTAAQWGLNAAMLASPITWIILAIIALIVIIYLVVGAINKFAGTSISATGAIFGAFALLGVGIYNIVLGLFNGLIQLLWTIFVEPWIGIIEWVLNVFNGGFDSFGDGAANLLGQVISWFMSLGKIATKIIDAIFGTNWTDELSSLQDSVLAWGKNDDAITLSREAPDPGDIGIIRADYGDAWNAGYNAGENLLNINGLNTILEENPWDPNQFSNIDQVGEVGKINNTVDISSEDLKTMRELAEMKNIQNFVTLTPTVTVSTGDIRSGDEADSIVMKIQTMLETQIASSAEGVYA